MKLSCLYLLLRRIAAFLYDCLLLIALFFLLTAIAIFYNEGEAIESIVYKFILIPVAGIFFCSFWKQGGQTLGMRAWHIKLVNNNEGEPSWLACVIRYTSGVLLFGITHFYALFDKECKSLHDRLSGTEIKLKKPNK